MSGRRFNAQRQQRGNARGKRPSSIVGVERALEETRRAGEIAAAKVPAAKSAARTRSPKLDESKQCLRCGELGHRLSECTRIKPRPLEQVRCHACAVHHAEHAHHRQVRAVHEQYASVGADGVGYTQSYAYEINEPLAAARDLPLPVVTRLLREHGFDKRAAISAIAHKPADGDVLMRMTAAAVALLPENPGEDDFANAIASMPENPSWDRVRRDLAWSDWPSESVFFFYDGVSGVDPLDETARRRFLWGARS